MTLDRSIITAQADHNHFDFPLTADWLIAPGKSAGSPSLTNQEADATIFRENLTKAHGVFGGIDLTGNERIFVVIIEELITLTKANIKPGLLFSFATDSETWKATNVQLLLQDTQAWCLCVKSGRYIAGT